MAGAMAAAASSTGALPARAAKPEPFGPLGRPSWTPDGLNAAAAAKGLAYGTSVPIGRFRQDPRYLGIVSRECGILVCDNVMKMDLVVPQEASLDFGNADDTLRFARSNGQRMRGHCLIWHEALPDWAKRELASGNPARAEALMRRWIGAMVRRYEGQIEAWDVVNEIVAPQQGRPDGLRVTPWLKALGPSYVETAFHLAQEADPKAAGVWNEDDLELGAPFIDQRRSTVLRLMEGFLRRGVPIRRMGMQAHLYTTHSIDEKALRGFLRELAGMGLAIEVTELDIDDRALPADITARDEGVADFGRRFLDIVLDEPAVLDVVTWDLYDPDTWLNDSPARRRPDGLPQRALPYDAQYRRKPLWHAMLKAFRDAPDHSAVRARLRKA